MRDDRNKNPRRKLIVRLAILLALIALFFAGMHVLSGADFSSLHSI